ncbi:phage tail tape measure protein [Streptomyces sp. UG1]|uniref:phage tail tape measure protein n=1 Tax=Streptomyces sp. UG1 TaxID=3417652 RepID=UPI003CE81BED
MKQVRAVTGATGEDFTDLRDQAKPLGATTKFSATQAAAGRRRHGLPGHGGLPDQRHHGRHAAGVLSLASAGNMDLARSADVASNILTGYGSKANQLGGRPRERNQEALFSERRVLQPPLVTVVHSVREATTVRTGKGDRAASRRHLARAERRRNRLDIHIGPPQCSPPRSHADPYPRNRTAPSPSAAAPQDLCQNRVSSVGEFRQQPEGLRGVFWALLTSSARRPLAATSRGASAAWWSSSSCLGAGWDF